MILSPLFSLMSELVSSYTFNQTVVERVQSLSSCRFIAFVLLLFKVILLYSLLDPSAFFILLLGVPYSKRLRNWHLSAYHDMTDVLYCNVMLFWYLNNSWGTSKLLFMYWVHLPNVLFFLLNIFLSLSQKLTPRSVIYLLCWKFSEKERNLSHACSIYFTGFCFLHSLILFVSQSRLSSLFYGRLLLIWCLPVYVSLFPLW